ncbi:MAG: hypothetical protein FJZ90_15265 [Chloroflexi bacterium]|nr:hypothetical protein [Chloroflexota bacterium]
MAGYDRGGEVLYGWSYFQEGQGAYYESADWFETMDRHAGKGLIVIGDKLASRPSPRDVLVASLEWAVALARTVRWPHLPEHVGGLAAYDTWADGLGVDADYPPDSEEILATRVMVHADQCTMLDERRNAAGYLRQTADVAPEVAEHLRTAATLFDAAADHVGPAWPWSYSMGRDAQLGLSDAGTRQEVAGHVRAAGALEAQAVEVLERALAKLR